MANPTIGATTPRIQYTATASQTLFTVPFEFIADADLAVYVNGTIKTLTTDYTVAGANTSGGGSITFVIGRTAGEVVTILGDQDYSRNTNKYTKYGLLPAEVLEADFDSLTVQTKQLARDGQFALRAPLTDTVTPDMVLPVKTIRASKLLGFDSNGNPVASSSTVTAMDAAVTAINTIAGAASGSSASISHIATGAGAVATTVQAKLRESVSVLDFGSLAEAVAAAPDGGSIYCPPGYTHTVASTITINKSLTIWGKNWTGVSITGPANSPIFQGSGTVTNFVLEGITWIGGTGTSQLLKVPTGVFWSESKIKIIANKINNFGAFAIERGDSVYLTEIRGNRFDNCVGCISEGWASDSVIDDNLFNDGMSGNPVMSLVGGARTIITSNVFVRASGTITEADIVFNPNTSFGRGGRAFVLHNKFGGEGETSSRPKIRTYNATANNRATDVVVAFNQLHGMGGTTGTTHCFQFDNPIANWDIFGNEFDNFDLIVQDNVGKFDGLLGSNKFGHNRYFWSDRINGKLFSNDGRMFSELDENVYGYQMPRIMYEPREARNRLWNSTAITSWNKSTGVTITSGQSDPDGGTNAYLIESDGTVAAQNVFRSIDITGIGNTVILKLRLKAQASSKIIVGLRDSGAPSGWVGMLQNLVLDSQWRDYVFQLTLVNPANAHQLYIYPGDSVVTRAGGFYIYQPQISDYESDFLPTPSNVGVSDTTIGRRFGKKVSIAGGAKATLPTYADNAAALVGGLIATDIYKTATGEVRIVV